MVVKYNFKKRIFFQLFKFLRWSWAWDWEWSSNQSLYSAGDSGVINAPCLSTTQTLRSDEISQPLLTISKNEKIFSRSHMSTLYALLRSFSEIYNERLHSWSIRHFATRASLEHISSPMRHFARRATLFQIARMHHFAKNIP